MPQLATLRRRILSWYRREGRDFIWRRTSDPYEILVSEVMLQQTQASRVEEKMPLFLQRFPTFQALARSTTGDVVRAWQGMGYNNRAVRLRDLARIVVERDSGRLPEDPETLDTLPGVGRYTSHAVACFAYRRRVPVVDVNVHRLFSRLFWRMKDRSARKDLDTIWDIAKDVLPENAWAWNQSIIELGATICTAAKPACDRCPVKEYCASSHLAVHLAARSANGRSKRTAAKPTRVRNSEPLYDGVPRRLWRGRLVQVLRTVQKTRSLSLNDLGKALKPGFHVSEMEWLRGLVDRLASDGVVRTLKRSGDLRVALPVE